MKDFAKAAKKVKFDKKKLNEYLGTKGMKRVYIGIDPTLYSDLCLVAASVTKKYQMIVSPENIAGYVITEMCKHLTSKK